jgi:hypothetical protein
MPDMIRIPLELLASFSLWALLAVFVLVVAFIAFVVVFGLSLTIRDHMAARKRKANQ